MCMLSAQPLFLFYLFFFKQAKGHLYLIRKSTNITLRDDGFLLICFILDAHLFSKNKKIFI